MREVICADALEWLPAHPGLGAIVTSLPDAHEMGWTVDEWRPWFLRAAAITLRATATTAPCVFYQTDRKHDGRLESKAALLMGVAEDAGLRPLWHKIALRRRVGATDLHRPGYSHLLAFSRAGRPGPATPDVFSAGAMVYPDGMGIDAAAVAVGFALRASATIVDPFCGRGTVLAVAEQLGGSATGVDIDPRQVDYARSLRLSGSMAGSPSREEEYVRAS